MVYEDDFFTDSFPIDEIRGKMLVRDAAGNETFNSFNDVKDDRHINNHYITSQDRMQCFWTANPQEICTVSKVISLKIDMSTRRSAQPMMDLYMMRNPDWPNEYFCPDGIIADEPFPLSEHITLTKQ